MPSAGILPFMQSFMCTFNNTCHAEENADEMPGMAGSFTQTGWVYIDSMAFLSQACCMVMFCLMTEN